MIIIKNAINRVFKNTFAVLNLKFEEYIYFRKTGLV